MAGFCKSNALCIAILLIFPVLLIDGQVIDFYHVQKHFSNEMFSNSSNTTSPPPGPPGPMWVGYVAAVVAILFFGSNFVPVKKFETGDGMFFQWVLCLAIWIGGLIANCIQHFPQFYPLAMLGGFLWATGNICVVPIIHTIGLGLGILIWGSFNLLSGWVTGRFGLFGLDPEVPNNPTMNYIAIGFAMLSAVFWVFVKSDTTAHVEDELEDETTLLNENDVEITRDVDQKEEIFIYTNQSLTNRMKQAFTHPLYKRIIGCTLSVFSGTLYGLSFTPVIYIKNNYKGASQVDVDYVFAHFSGILATSTLYFVIYCIVMKNRPNVYPRVILPGLISGGMWAVADIAWFVANNYLSEAVSFPIITTGPGIIASLWGVLVFKEVKGRKNFIIMGIAYSFTITGAVLAGLSKS